MIIKIHLKKFKKNLIISKIEYFKIILGLNLDLIKNLLKILITGGTQELKLKVHKLI